MSPASFDDPERDEAGKDREAVLLVCRERPTRGPGPEAAPRLGWQFGLAMESFPGEPSLGIPAGREYCAAKEYAESLTGVYAETARQELIVEDCLLRWGGPAESGTHRASNL